eukprot:5242643-Pleurochrysis_carterae.AAC.2
MRVTLKVASDKLANSSYISVLTKYAFCQLCITIAVACVLRNRVQEEDKARKLRTCMKSKLQSSAIALAGMVCFIRSTYGYAPRHNTTFLA